MRVLALVLLGLLVVGVVVALVAHPTSRAWAKRLWPVLAGLGAFLVGGAVFSPWPGRRRRRMDLTPPPLTRQPEADAALDEAERMADASRHTFAARRAAIERMPPGPERKAATERLVRDVREGRL